MTLILRRAGSGNWSTIRVSYDAARQAELPTLVEARRGQTFVVGGATFKISRVLP